MRKALSILAAGLLLSSCGGREEEQRPESAPAAGMAAFVEEVLPSPRPGLEIIRLAPPGGERVARPGDEVLLDLASSRGGEEEWSGRFGFLLGSGQGSPALEEGVTGAGVGESRRLTVGIRVGGGPAGEPPQGRQVYEFTLLEIHPGEASQ